MVFCRTQFVVALAIEIGSKEHENHINFYGTPRAQPNRLKLMFQR